MEVIHTYRHIIPKEVIEHFEEAAKEVLRKNKPKNLGFIALMVDSERKEHHDIDMIVFPNSKAKIGEAMIELVEFYNSIEKELKVKHERYYLATCPKMAMQQLIYYISALEEGAAGLIPVHSMFFTDYKSFTKISPAKFWKKVEKGIDIVPLHGNFESVKKTIPLPPKKLEPYFFVLDFELNNRIKTFPRHLIRSSAQHLFDYLRLKYNIEIKDKLPHNVEEIDKEFIKIMKNLDKITYSKT